MRAYLCEDDVVVACQRLPDSELLCKVEIHLSHRDCAAVADG
ncbi:hypothetical protein [Haloactinomyces albus]|uniref:Uncharacterized protein n=1 Tax=Haloactinomyces albus TaxID=1352928 RepID=A0AAE3ZG62_9ACTN|nr:hypothetical protein [Haloactinomyces albus]MDR7302944.1 hypothetical protein [Haloactinomyces albus]